MFFLCWPLFLCVTVNTWCCPVNGNYPHTVGVSRQRPIICRATSCCFSAYLPHYCHLFLSSVWKAMQFRSIHKKNTHLNKERLHTLVPQPVECRETKAKYVGLPLRYHVILCECGSMPVLQGHSEDQVSPPPTSCIVLSPRPLVIKLNGAPAGSQRAVYGHPHHQLVY